MGPFGIRLTRWLSFLCGMYWLSLNSRKALMLFYSRSGLDLANFISPDLRRTGTPFQFPTGTDGRVSSSPSFTYDLYAVSNHYGGLNGGHYTAHVYNGYKQNWFYFDDTRVSQSNEHDAQVSISPPSNWGMLTYCYILEQSGIHLDLCSQGIECWKPDPQHDPFTSRTTCLIVM